MIEQLSRLPPGEDYLTELPAVGSSLREVPRRASLACLILVIGAIIYAFLCCPAIGCRGFPPIDPIWYGLAYSFWIAPVMLSALFDSYKFRGRNHGLLAYALVTAFFDAGTPVDVVPRQVSPIGMLLYTILVFGPLHLAITFTVEATIQLLLRRQRMLSEKLPENAPLKISLLEWFIGYSAICIAIGCPLALREFEVSSSRARGIHKADADWQAGSVTLHEDNIEGTWGDTSIEYFVDRETGLPQKHRFPDQGFSQAYDDRIRELIRVKGTPPWIAAADLPDAESVAKLLDRTDIPELPDGNSIQFGNVTVENAKGRARVRSQRFEPYEMGDPQKTVYADVQGNLLIVRCGHNQVLIFDRDGRKLVSATR